VPSCKLSALLSTALRQSCSSQSPSPSWIRSSTLSYLISSLLEAPCGLSPVQIVNSSSSSCPQTVSGWVSTLSSCSTHSCASSWLWRDVWRCIWLN
jgi:hypothetical protein